MGLLDQLLAGTRFDNKSRIEQDMANSNFTPGGVPIQPVAQPVAQVPAQGGGPEAMIRRLRAQRAAEKQAQALQFLQSQGGQVLPQR